VFTFEGSPMQRTPKSTRFRRRSGRVTVAMAVSCAVVVLAGVALAKTNTLSVAKNAKVTNSKTGATSTKTIAVNNKGRAVYLLTGDSKNHPECVQNNGCLAVWFPVTVKSASTKPVVAKGIKGKVTLWHRMGFFQVVVAGHPLYTFKFDTQKDHATGEAITSFGGTWHVIPASVKSSTKSASSPPAMTPPSSAPPLYP
jgi:predicted lipoprotein with Yx(FWY)xxD motif